MERPIFISYSSKDKPMVERIVGSLSAKKINLWFDRWEIRVGDSIANKISEGIKKSSYLLLILSTNSVKSPWVEKEMNAALMKEINSRNVVILPALIENCEFPEILKDKKYGRVKHWRSGCRLIFVFPVSLCFL